MRDLDYAPGLLGALVMLVLSVTWIAFVALQEPTDYAAVPRVSSDMSAVAILVLWIAVALSCALTPPTGPTQRQQLFLHAGTSAVGVMLPLWPLLTLLWLTSHVPATTLMTAQVIAVAIAAIASLTAHAVATSSRPPEAAGLLRAAVGLGFAAVVFANRSAVFAWVTQ